MGKYEKLYKRMLELPRDFTMNELRTVMKHNGFEEKNRGKTSGSAIRFFNKVDNRVLDFHRPHPEDEVPVYVLKKAIKVLEGKVK